MDIPDWLIFSCATAVTVFRIKSIGVCAGDLAGDAPGACMDVRGVIEASSFATTVDFVVGDCSVMMLSLTLTLSFHNKQETVLKLLSPLSITVKKIT
jgi:hypothetical protein